MDVSAVRSRQLQGSLSASEKRMQRAKNTIKIGKNKRLESMQKRRGAASAASTAKSNAEAVQQAGSLPKELSLDNLSLYFQGMCRGLWTRSSRRHHACSHNRDFNTPHKPTPPYQTQLCAAVTHPFSLRVFTTSVDCCPRSSHLQLKPCSAQACCLAWCRSWTPATPAWSSSHAGPSQTLLQLSTLIW